MTKKSRMLIGVLFTFSVLGLPMSSFASSRDLFLPHNFEDDHINYSSHLLALNKTPGVTELSVFLIHGDFVVDQESLVRVVTKDEDFSRKEYSSYFWAPISFRVTVKEVRAAASRVIKRAGSNSRGAKLYFVLTHISTASSNPNMPLMRPLTIQFSDFSNQLENKVTAKPFHSIFSLYDGGERQLSADNRKQSSVLIGYQIHFFRTLMKGSFPVSGNSFSNLPNYSTSN